jgi:hypothetical protein
MTNLIRLNPIRWPYSLQQLREDQPSRSFSNAPSPAEYAYYNVYRFEDVVTLVAPPEVDPATQRLEQLPPEEIAGVLTQQWRVVTLTPEEAEAYYRLTHPPRWLEFWEALPPEVDGLLTAAGQVKRRLEHGLASGLSRAASGDSRVFLSAWHDASSLGLIPPELITGIQALAVQYDLPADFVAGLAAEGQP